MRFAVALLAVWVILVIDEIRGRVLGAFWYGYHKDIHTSIVGIREYADGKGKPKLEHGRVRAIISEMSCACSTTLTILTTDANDATTQTATVWSLHRLERD